MKPSSHSYIAPRLQQLALYVIAALVVSGSAAEGATPTSKVRFYMNMGTVEIELYGTQSPLNVANFLSYVDNGSYNDSMIHRTRDGSEVATSDLFAQGGSYKYNSLNGITTAAPVNNEFNAANGLSNTKYTLAAARTTGLNTATSGWFINQTNNSAAFDNPASPYTVLGKVTVGTSIIDAIPFLPNLPILLGTQLESMPVYNNGEVIINKAIRIPILPGDYNFSGSVTSADYTIWRNNFGSTTNLAADGNGNGVVDAADYVIWRKLTSGSGSGSSSLTAGGVPEPASVFLLISGTFMLATRRSRRTGIERKIA